MIERACGTCRHMVQRTLTHPEYGSGLATICTFWPKWEEVVLDHWCSQYAPTPEEIFGAPRERQDAAQPEEEAVRSEQSSGPGAVDDRRGVRPRRK